MKGFQGVERIQNVKRSGVRLESGGKAAGCEDF
jgi:hypothetical protein